MSDKCASVNKGQPNLNKTQPLWDFAMVNGCGCTRRWHAYEKNRNKTTIKKAQHLGKKKR